MTNTSTIKMYKYIILCLSVCLCVQCDLNKKEGADCEWEGLKGKCVSESRCLTTLDDRSPKQPVCSKQGEKTIICCTDCELVNDTSNAVLSPTSELFWKDGRKARDSCLTYLKDLPYICRESSYGLIQRSIDEEKKCHTYNLMAVGGLSVNPDARAKYPHQALLGYGDSVDTAKWFAGGSIISDRYILTVAHVNSFQGQGPLNFVALGVLNRSDPPSSWQVLRVKRYIAHPEYKAPSKYYDIGLIETEAPIKFNGNVLPACLHVEEIDTTEAEATTWKSLTDSVKMADTIQTIKNMEQFSDEECTSVYGKMRHLKLGYDSKSQMCFGSRKNPMESCRGLSGEPLLVQNQFSHCVYTVIGVTSFGINRCASDSVIPDIYTRVSHYVPWIESVVWP